MLVQYTPVSALTPGELSQLKQVVLSGIRLEGQSHYTFNGKSFAVADLMAHKRMWESEKAVSGRQTLLG